MFVHISDFDYIAPGHTEVVHHAKRLLLLLQKGTTRRPCCEDTTNGSCGNAYLPRASVTQHSTTVMNIGLRIHQGQCRSWWLLSAESPQVFDKNTYLSPDLLNAQLVKGKMWARSILNR